LSKLEKKMRKLLSQPSNVDFETLDYVLVRLGCVDKRRQRVSCGI